MSKINFRNPKPTTRTDWWLDRGRGPIHFGCGGSVIDGDPLAGTAQEAWCIRCGTRWRRPSGRHIWRRQEETP